VRDAWARHVPDRSVGRVRSFILSACEPEQVSYDVKFPQGWHGSMA
jgi:hypothetical protein